MCVSQHVIDSKLVIMYFSGVLLVDLDDDLFLGADAQVFSTSGSVEAASASPGSSSLSTG